MSDIEAQFQPVQPRFASNVQGPKDAENVLAIVQPLEERGRLPYSREDFVKTENPALVEWERQTRLYLSRLNADFGHRITAPMVYEWVTGRSIKEDARAEGADEASPRGGGQNGSANMHLRLINRILRDYFGQPRKTTIMGRGVGKAYTVRPHFQVKLKKPTCLTLWPDWDAGTLNP